MVSFFFYRRVRLTLPYKCVSFNNYNHKWPLFYICVTELRSEYRVFIVQYIHVVAAVYVDQQRQNSRVANLFVSGLQPLPSVADATVVSDFCRSYELGIVPDIVHCRRLGKMNPARVQPLLVVLRSADQADEIMTNAKNLCKSTHSVIREGVFFNRHLTDAQSRAAFELRCNRRDAASRRGRHGAPPSTNAATISAAAPVAPGIQCCSSAAFISTLSGANWLSRSDAQSKCEPTLYLLNADHLVKRRALQQLAADLKQNDVDCAMITKTWFTKKHSDEHVSIQSIFCFII